MELGFFGGDRCDRCWPLGLRGALTLAGDAPRAAPRVRAIGERASGSRCEACVTSFGHSVASAGDVNGDGYSDVIVGAPYYDNGETDEGAAFVFLGGPSGVASGNPSTAAALLESNQSAAELGWSVASAGDVNGDGYGDVIVGAVLYSNGASLEGAALVYLGGPSGVASGDPSAAATLLESNQEFGRLGFSVASAGDVNGDGYADVIVGAPVYYLSARSTYGVALVFLGSPAGVASGDPSTAATLLSHWSNQLFGVLFGWSVASAGDVNGDGYADVIVGAPGYDDGETDEGAAFVFLGSSAGIPSGDIGTAAAGLESNQADAAAPSNILGSSVASAGDVNGDGFGDVILGFQRYDNGETDEGAAFVFVGNGGQNGRPVLARQERGDGSFRPVQPWSASGANGRFGVEIAASHPEGTGRVRPEYEACPPGKPFGDASCTSAVYPSWVPVGGSLPDADFAENLVGLTSNTLYRWRARVQRAPATGPLPTQPAHGPWRRVLAQAIEADVRVVPEPGLTLQLGVALAGLAVGARLRRAPGRGGPVRISGRSGRRE